MNLESQKSVKLASIKKGHRFTVNTSQNEDLSLLLHNL